MKPNGVEIVLKILLLLYEYNVNSTSFIVQCLNAGASDAVALFFEKKKKRKKKEKKRKRKIRWKKDLHEIFRRFHYTAK